MTSSGQPIRTPEGLRWSCRSCGSCCTSDYDLGPVEPEVIADLTAAGIEGLWAPASDGWHHDQPTGVFLDTVDGHCVFLRDDKRCAVHDLLGGHRKPGFCREFPYHLVEDPLGWVAVVRPTCRGFHGSSRDGDAVGPELEKIAALPRLVPRRRFAPQAVNILDGASVSLETWMKGEQALLSGLCGLDLHEAITALRQRLHVAAHRTVPPIRPPQHQAALEAIVTALAMIMRHTLKQPGGQDPERVDFAQKSLADLERVLATVDRPAPALAADAEEWVNLLLRSELLAKRFAVWGGVAEGLGEFILAIEVSRRLAEPDPSGQITAAALSEPLAHWRRFAAIELITMILRKARPALIDLFLHERSP